MTFAVKTSQIENPKALLMIKIKMKNFRVFILPVIIVIRPYIYIYIFYFQLLLKCVITKTPFLCMAGIIATQKY
jgi:hypothetical protein